MTDKRRQRRRRWARIRDYESAVYALLDELPQSHVEIDTYPRTPVTLYHEPSDEDRNAVEAIEDARRERDDG